MPVTDLPKDPKDNPKPKRKRKDKNNYVATMEYYKINFFKELLNVSTELIRQILSKENNSDKENKGSSRCLRGSEMW